MNYLKSFFKTYLFVIVISLITCVVVVGYYAHVTISKNVYNHTGKYLKTLSQLKTEQISNWYLDELQDAQIIANNYFLESIFKTYLQNTNSKHEVVIFLRELIKQHGEQNIMIVDSQSNIIVNANDSLDFMYPKLFQDCDSVEKTIWATDIYINSQVKNFQIGFLAKIPLNNTSKTYYLLFQNNVENTLFPLVQNLFADYKTLESLIVHKGEKTVVIENFVRDSSYRNKFLEHSLTKVNVPAVQVVLGRVGLFEGVDYRNMEVFSYLEKIDSTPWCMVTKLDTQEMYSSMKLYTGLIILFVIVFIIIIIFVAAYIYTNKQRKVYKNLYTVQQQFKTTLYSIGDGVIITDNKGKVVLMNPIAEVLTGWTEAEASGKDIETVFHIVKENSLEKAINPVLEVLSKGVIVGLANHTLLISKQGPQVAIADSAAPIRNAEGSLDGVVLVFRDQTVEQNTRREIEENNRKLSTLLSNLPGVAYSCLNNQNWDMLFLSPSVESLTGYSYKDFIVRKSISFGAIIHSDDRQKVYDEIQKGIFSKSQFQIEYRIIAKDGVEKWVWDQGQGVFSQTGELISIEGYLVDMSLHKSNQEELSKSKQIMELIFNSLPIRIFWKDINLQYQGGNLNFLRDALMDSISELKGKTDFDMLWCNNADAYRADDNEVIQTGIQKINFEEEVLFSENEFSWIRTSKVPLRNSEGKIEGVLGTYEDITQQKQSEKQIQLQIRAIEQSPVCIVITNSKGLIEYVNPKFSDVTGYSKEEAIGKNPNILKSGYQNKDFYEILWKTISKGNQWQGELHNKKKNGDLYWENAVISPILNSKGIVTHYVAIKEDVTDKKKLYQELIEAKEHAVESDKLKSVFLANMSHEIRTPMNGIIGFSEMLLDPNLQTNDRQEFAKIVVNSSKQLLNIVEDILDISKIEAGEVNINRDKLIVNHLIHEVFTFFRPQAMKKGILFQEILPLSDDQSMIFSDKNRIRQVLLNFLSNSLKFTHSGSISIGYKVVDNSIELFVTDTGIGIASEMQVKIFERFRQAEMDINNQYGGTGLGLSISKKLVNLLQSEIIVVSELGTGSTFSFVLPLMKNIEYIQNQNILPTSIIIPNFNNAIILIAEDNDTNFQYLQAVLSKANIKIIRAYNGEQAINYCRENLDIVFVLMDIRMPDVDGIQATKEIKEFRPNLPIALQSAYKIDENENIQTAGCDDYLTKPIKKIDLYRCLSKYIITMNS